MLFVEIVLKKCLFRYMADLNEKKTCENVWMGDYEECRARRIAEARYRWKPKRWCKAKTKAGKPCKCVEGTYDQVFTSDGYCTFHKSYSTDKEPDDVPMERLLGECKDEDFPPDENTKP